MSVVGNIASNTIKGAASLAIDAATFLAATIPAKASMMLVKALDVDNSAGHITGAIDAGIDEGTQLATNIAKGVADSTVDLAGAGLSQLGNIVPTPGPTKPGNPQGQSGPVV